MTLAQARKLALALPEASEEPHFDKWSFRVRGKIFATVPPDGKHLHVFVGDDLTAAMVALRPSAFEELWWGKNPVGVRVDLPAADAKSVAALLEESWRRKAPRALVVAFDARAPRPRPKAATGRARWQGAERPRRRAPQ